MLQPAWRQPSRWLHGGNTGHTPTAALHIGAMHLPAPTRRDLERAEARAQAVAACFDLSARLDPEVATTWHLAGEHAGRPIEIELGSPRLRRWGARAVTHWLHLTLHEATWLPVDAELRPASRNVWQWREGEPGEEPHLRVRHAELGVLQYLLLPESLHHDALSRAEHALRSLPRDVSWFRATHDGWQMRVSQLDEATPPEEVLQRLAAWQGMQPLS